MERNTLKKEERLCSKRSIDDLFRNGSSFVLYPYRVLFQWSSGPEKDQRDLEARVLFSVSKRRFRRAVDRNRIKRQMREAYRQQKHLLAGLSKGTLEIALLYIGREAVEFPTTFSKMKAVIEKLKNQSETCGS